MTIYRKLMTIIRKKERREDEKRERGESVKSEQ